MYLSVAWFLFFRQLAHPPGRAFVSVFVSIRSTSVAPSLPIDAKFPIKKQPIKERDFYLMKLLELRIVEKIQDEPPNFQKMTSTSIN